MGGAQKDNNDESNKAFTVGKLDSTHRIKKHRNISILLTYVLASLACTSSPTHSNTSQDLGTQKC